MKHKRYSHLPTNDKYILVESSGTVNKKKIYRSKKSNLQNIKNEIEIFKYDKSTHYMNNVLIRNGKANNILAYMFLCLKRFGKIKIDYYQEMNEAIKEINNTKFNSLYITPSIYWNFKDKIDLKHYEFIFLAGEQISPTIKESLLNNTNANIYDMYGGADAGLVAYRNIKNDYHTVAPSIKLLKNNENRIEFLRKDSGACDFIEDETGLQDLRHNLTYIGNDFVEIIDDKRFVYLGRDNSFVKINEKKIYLNQIKEFILKKTDIVDLQLIKYKDENQFDQFCMYVISQEKYETDILKELILREFNDMNFVPKKILVDNKYLTKNLNSDQMIKTDTQKLLKMVLENGRETY